MPQTHQENAIRINTFRISYDEYCSLLNPHSTGRSISSGVLMLAGDLTEAQRLGPLSTEFE